MEQLDLLIKGSNNNIEKRIELCLRAINGEIVINKMYDRNKDQTNIILDLNNSRNNSIRIAEEELIQIDFRDIEKYINENNNQRYALDVFNAYNHNCIWEYKKQVNKIINILPTLTNKDLKAEVFLAHSLYFGDDMFNIWEEDEEEGIRMFIKVISECMKKIQKKNKEKKEEEKKEEEKEINLANADIETKLFLRAFITYSFIRGKTIEEVVDALKKINIIINDDIVLIAYEALTLPFMEKVRRKKEKQLLEEKKQLEEKIKNFEISCQNQEKIISMLKKQLDSGRLSVNKLSADIHNIEEEIRCNEENILAQDNLIWDYGDKLCGLREYNINTYAEILTLLDPETTKEEAIAAIKVSLERNGKIEINETKESFVKKVKGEKEKKQMSELYTKLVSNIENITLVTNTLKECSKQQKLLMENNGKLMVILEKKRKKIEIKNKENEKTEENIHNKNETLTYLYIRLEQSDKALENFMEINQQLQNI